MDWVQPFEARLPSDTIISPVEGYRIWFVPPDQTALHSFWMTEYEWTPCRRVEARCLSHLTCTCSTTVFKPYLEAAKVINMTCNAGIYAFKTFDQAAQEFLWHYEEMYGAVEAARAANVADKIYYGSGTNIALGRVYLWGKVLEYSRGFRGQFAYPSSLYNTSEKSAALAARYRVPLIRSQEIQ